MEKKHKSGKKALRIVGSILIAIVIWLYVDTQLATDATMNVNGIPVEFSGENTILADRGLMILSGHENTIDLKISGPRKTLYRLDKEKIRIVVDTSSITETGVQSLGYQVVYPDNILRSSITVQNASVYAVTVTIGEMATKEVPIQCNITGKVAENYTVGEVTLNPETVELRGQPEDLVGVSYAQVDLDISGATERVADTLEVSLYDYNGDKVDNDNIRQSVLMAEVSVPVTTVKKVDLKVNFEESPGSTLEQTECTIVPAKISLAGDKTALDAVQDIVLDTIDLQNLQPSQTLTYEIPVPENTTLISEESVAVITIVVNDVSERTIAVNKFSCMNLPDGWNASVVTESLDVVLRGLNDEIASITAKNIQVAADLSKIKESGSFTVPAKITVKNYENVGAKGDYQVIVKVWKD